MALTLLVDLRFAPDVSDATSRFVEPLAPDPGLILGLYGR